jgi:hypothetical protein
MIDKIIKSKIKRKKPELLRKLAGVIGFSH